MQHILVHSKMNGLCPLLTAPPVFAFRQLRGDSKKCCRLLHYKSNYQSCTTLLGGKGEFPWPAQKITGNISSIPFTPFAKSLSATPVSTGSNPVCASLEGPQKLLVFGVFSCPENLCVTNLYIAETRIKSRVTGIFLCFKIAILILLYQ